LLEGAKGGRNRAADISAAHMLIHEATKTHLSQSNGATALAGQHAIASPVSAIADAGISSSIAETEASPVVPAIAGRDSGERAKPAITRIASSRRIVM